jgi:hypothetical protein
MQPIRFSTGAQPAYDALWLHAGRVYIKCRQDIVFDLVQDIIDNSKSTVKLHLSDKWAHDLRVNTWQIQIDDSGTIISWEYIR